MKFEYSADGGTSCPTTTAPVYDSSTPVIVKARCIIDATYTFTENLTASYWMLVSLLKNTNNFFITSPIKMVELSCLFLYIK